MNIQEETQQILAQRLFSAFDSKKLVEWAMIILKNNYESESLIILAGLDHETTEEREKYFWLAIKELKIEININNFDLLENYAIHIAQSVINKKISSLEGLEIMYKIVQATDYSGKYIQFYEIDEDLDYLKRDNTVIYNSGLSLENADSYILKEFELFLEIEKYKINEDIRQSAYCTKCGSIDKPILKTKRNIFGHPKFQMWICKNCNSQDILHFKSQKGKEIILKKIINAT